MTKEQLKNIFIENKCVASDEWNNENPFVATDLDMLYDILEKDKQQLIEKACDTIKHLLGGYVIRNFNFGDSYDMDELINDFKKAMKGE